MDRVVVVVAGALSAATARGLEEAMAGTAHSVRVVQGPEQLLAEAAAAGALDRDTAEPAGLAAARYGLERVYKLRKEPRLRMADYVPLPQRTHPTTARQLRSAERGRRR